MRATFSQVQTNYINQTHSNGATHEVLHTGYVDGMNVLGTI